MRVVFAGDRYEVAAEGERLIDAGDLRAAHELFTRYRRALTPEQHDALDAFGSHYPEAKVCGWYIDGPVLRRGADFRYVDTDGQLRPLPPGHRYGGAR